MKLLWCEECGDIFKLWISAVRRCHCGKTAGAYEEDGLNAWYRGPAKPIGISNYTFIKAFYEDDLEPKEIPGEDGYRFEAFFIPKVAPTLRKTDG